MDRAKEIIATFIKKDATQINNDTLIDKSVIPGSVLLHRMYSALSAEGYHIVNKDKIRTYGDFVAEINKTDNVSESKLESKSITVDKKIANRGSNGLSVGIDIEDIFNMPIASDYREHKFYLDNFSQKEISYAILQADPRATFAGRFAAKEAIVKADNSYKMVPFKEIEILNDDNGKPIFKDFVLSISHSNNEAVAIALKGFDIKIQSKDGNQFTKNEVSKLIEKSMLNAKRNNFSSKLNYISLFISLIAIILVIYQSL